MFLMMSALVLIASACGDDAVADGSTTAPPGSAAAASLDGGRWFVVGGSLDGVALVPPQGRTPTLAVDGARASGSTGCNTFDGRITVAPAGGVSITGLAVTEIGCEPDVMAFEAGLIGVLERIDRFASDADTLTLSDAAGTAELDLSAVAPVVPASLAGSWSLTGLASGPSIASVLAGTAPSLVIDLDAGAIRGNGGCNDFGGRLAVNGNRLAVTEMVNTEIGCEQGIMRQESDYLFTLSNAAFWQIDGSSLTIATADGRAAVFAPGS